MIYLLFISYTKSKNTKLFKLIKNFFFTILESYLSNYMEDLPCYRWQFNYKNKIKVSYAIQKIYLISMKLTSWCFDSNGAFVGCIYHQKQTTQYNIYPSNSP